MFNYVEPREVKQIRYLLFIMYFSRYEFIDKKKHNFGASYSKISSTILDECVKDKINIGLSVIFRDKSTGRNK